MGLLGVHHVSINVVDLDEATAFYRDVLGLKVLTNRPQLRVDGTWLAMPDGRELHLIVADVPANVGQHFAFEVDDLDAVASHLASHGVSTSEPALMQGICRQAFCEDPAGNLLEFNERL